MDWTPEKIQEEEMADKTNYTPIIVSLIRLWTFDPYFITAVVMELKSYDQANEYLELMDSLNVDHPMEAWDDWCIDNNIEHEMDNNPFEGGD